MQFSNVDNIIPRYTSHGIEIVFDMNLIKDICLNEHHRGCMGTLVAAKDYPTTIMSENDTLIWWESSTGGSKLKSAPRGVKPTS